MQSFHVQCAAYRPIWEKKEGLHSHSKLLEKIGSSGLAQAKSILSALVPET